MATYVDGFLIPLANDKIDQYRKIAKKASRMWIEHGALDYRECIGDDLLIQCVGDGHETPTVGSMSKAAQCKPDETVVFAWIEYASRAQRDRTNKAVMADPRMHAMMGECEGVFDPTRMAYGGFKAIVQASAARADAAAAKKSATKATKKPAATKKTARVAKTAASAKAAGRDTRTGSARGARGKQTARR